MARLGESHLISSSSAWRSLASSGEGAFELGLRSCLDSRCVGGGSILALPFQDSRSSPWPRPPLCAVFVCCPCYLYCGVLFSLQGLSPRLIFLPSSTPPGIRTEQDFYVRLIDSMTKQVSFLEFHIVGTILSSQNSLRFKNWLCHH